MMRPDKSARLYALLEAQIPACIEAGCFQAFLTDVTTHDRNWLAMPEHHTGVAVWIAYSSGSFLSWQRCPEVLRSFPLDHPEARYYVLDCDRETLTPMPNAAATQAAVQGRLRAA